MSGEPEGDASEVRSNRLFRAIAALAGSAVVGQAAGLAATPLLTRLYSPEAFGVLGVFLAVLSIGTVLGPLRYHLAILLPKDQGTAASILWLSLLLPLVVAVVFTAIAFIGGDSLPAQVRVSGELVWLLGIAIVLASAAEVLSTWGVRVQAIGAVAWSRSLEGVFKPAAQLISALSGMGGPLGLVLGAIIGRFLGLAALVRGIVRHDGWPRVGPPMREVASRFKRFPLVAGPGAVVNSLGLQLAPVLLALLYSPAVAGLFGLCNRVVGLPSVIIGRAVGEVYAGELGRLSQLGPGGRDEMLRLFRGTWTKTAKLAALPAAFLLAVGPWSFALVFGDEWWDAGRYAQIMAPMLVLQEAATPVSRTFNLLERQELQLWWSVGRLVLVATGFTVVAVLGLSGTAAVIAFSATMSVAYVVQLVMCRKALADFSPSQSTEPPGSREQEE